MIRAILRRLRGHRAVPTNREFAEQLRGRRVLYAMGEHCAISPYAMITDPKHVRLGNNVRLSECTILGHDGSVNMVNRLMHTKLDSVGSVTIGNNVFVGLGAIICQNTTIEDDVIIGAGAVVRGLIRGDGVYIGNPAVRVCSLDEHIGKLALRNREMPWRRLIQQREGEFDAAMEPEMLRLRTKHWFGAGCEE